MKRKLSNSEASPNKKPHIASSLDSSQSEKSEFDLNISGESADQNHQGSDCNGLQWNNQDILNPNNTGIPDWTSGVIDLDTQGLMNQYAPQMDPLPNNNNYYIVRWIVPGRDYGKPHTDSFYNQVTARSSYLVDGAEFKPKTETWVLINTPYVSLVVTDEHNNDVDFTTMDNGVDKKNKGKPRGPFYYPEDNPTHTLYKLRFNSSGQYTLTWNDIFGTPLAVNHVSCNDNTASTVEFCKPRTKKKNAVAVSPIVDALLPANYTIKQKNEPKKSLANIMFLLPEDPRHYYCVTKALSELRFRSVGSVRCFLSKEDVNILLINESDLLQNPGFRKFFNEYLLFIPSKGTIRPVSRVTIKNAPDLELNVRIDIDDAQVIPLSQLTRKQQTIVEFFRALPPQSRYITLSDASTNNALAQFLDYLQSWLFLASLQQVEQKDIYISTEVEENEHFTVEQVTDAVDQFRRAELPQQSAVQAAFHKCVAVVISGPPITWLVLVLKKKKLEEHLARKGLKLLNISLIDVKYVTKAMKNRRNKPYIDSMFSLVCQMPLNITPKHINDGEMKHGTLSSGENNSSSRMVTVEQTVSNLQNKPNESAETPSNFIPHDFSDIQTIADESMIERLKQAESEIADTSRYTSRLIDSEAWNRMVQALPELLRIIGSHKILTSNVSTFALIACYFGYAEGSDIRMTKGQAQAAYLLMWCIIGNQRKGTHLDSEEKPKIIHAINRSIVQKYFKRRKGTDRPVVKYYHEEFNAAVIVQFEVGSAQFVDALCHQMAKISSRDSIRRKKRETAPFNNPSDESDPQFADMSVILPQHDNYSFTSNTSQQYCEYYEQTLYDNNDMNSDTTIEFAFASLAETDFHTDWYSSVFK